MFSKLLSSNIKSIILGKKVKILLLKDFNFSEILNKNLISFGNIDYGGVILLSNLLIFNLFTENFKFLLLSQITNIKCDRIIIDNSFFSSFLIIYFSHISINSLKVTKNYVKNSCILFHHLKGKNLINNLLFENNQFKSHINNAFPLFLSINNCSIFFNNFTLFKNLVIIQLKNMIEIKKSELIKIQNTKFKENFANYGFLIRDSQSLEFFNFTCTSNNKNKGFHYKGNSSLFVQNLLNFTMSVCYFSNNYAISAACIVLFQSDNFQEIMIRNAEYSYYLIKNTTFFENSAEFISKTNFLGTSIFINSNGKFILLSTNFSKNINFHNSKLNKREGNPCLNLKGYKLLAQIIKSIFFMNKATFQSNCIFFEGKNFILNKSIFEENKNYAERQNLVQGGCFFGFSRQYFSI